jgi:hypothetical protein
VREWLRGIYADFRPQFIFRVTGVLIVIVLILFSQDDYDQDLWPNALWFFAAWGVVEVVRLIITDADER